MHNVFKKSFIVIPFEVKIYFVLKNGILRSSERKQISQSTPRCCKKLIANSCLHEKKESLCPFTRLLQSNLSLLCVFSTSLVV